MLCRLLNPNNLEQKGNCATKKNELLQRVDIKVDFIIIKYVYVLCKCYFLYISDRLVGFI